MIKINDDGVEVCGSISTLMEERITITASLHKSFSKRLGTEETNAMFVRGLFASTVDAAMDEDSNEVF